MTEPHIEIRAIYRSIARKPGKGSARSEILSDVSLTVNRGELITIMGPSGAGKSTLLRLINRLTEADSGLILLNNTDIQVFNPK